jgi:hypothetical protein
MPEFDSRPTRRSILALVASLAAWGILRTPVAAEPVMTIHKGPRCGCCGGWERHLQKNGFTTNAIETTKLDAVKVRLGVPHDLATCHTAEIDGYVIEGHVPASAVRRLLAERPMATGLAVPDMPIGSPGMENGQPELYEVILFGPRLRRSYMRFRADRQV